VEPGGDEERSPFLQRIRECEAQQVIAVLSPGQHVLEIGAGRGYQARVLARAGMSVEAIDLHPPLAGAVWPVRGYDGKVLPFADATFDIVFTSNVLEHVHDLEALLREIRRVLRAGGAAVHLVPSSTWRLWTSVIHYAHIGRAAWRRILGAGSSATMQQHGATQGTLHRGRYLRRLAYAERHGERGTAFGELLRFSRRSWAREFVAAGYSVEVGRGHGIYYSGYGFLGSTLSINSRRRLARWMGSSCHFFLLRPVGPRLNEHERQT